MKQSTGTGSFLELAEKLSGAWIMLLVFLLPLKFGSLAVMPEATGFFPEDWSAYLLISWPAHSLGMFSAVALALALCVFRPQGKFWREPVGQTALLWGLLLPLLTLPGWIEAPLRDYAVGETGHVLGIAALVGAVALMLLRKPQWGALVLGAVVAGTLWLSFSGLYQAFFGFAEMREFLQRQLEQGVEVSEVMKVKIADTRVYATFVSCNALGGYLLLVMPLTLAVLWRWGSRFEPERISRWLFLGVGVSAIGSVLLMTKSRASFLALLLTFGVFGLTLPMRRRWRAALLGVAAAVIVAGGIYIHIYGRGFLSAGERVDYLRSSAQMISERPLTGYGWGGFFLRHMALKTSSTDESARDPHNVIAAFASQAGIPAGILMGAVLLYPLVLLGRRVFRHGGHWLGKAIFWGEIAFLIHALADIDRLIPACLAMTGILAVVGLALNRGDPVEQTTTRGAFWMYWLLSGALACVAWAAWGFSWYWVKSELLYDRLLTLSRTMPTTPDGTIAVTAQMVEKALQDAAENKPYSPFAWEAAGDYFLRIGALEQAESCFQEAQKRSPERAALYRRFHDLALLRGQKAEARRMLEKMIQLFPSHPGYRKMLKASESQLP